MPRAIKDCDAAGETLPYSEMRRLPGDLFVQTDQSSRDSSHCSLACLFGGLDMQVDAPCKIETEFYGSKDFRGDGDDRHVSAARLLALGDLQLAQCLGVGRDALVQCFGDLLAMLGLPHQSFVARVGKEPDLRQHARHLRAD